MTLTKLILLLSAVLTLSAFSKKPVKVEQPVTPPPVAETPYIPEPDVPVDVTERIKLYWEDTTEKHPERIPWSDELTGLLTKDFALYSSAYDWSDICRNFKALDKVTKIKVMGEFWVAVAYYESSFKPGQESVDVGTKNDKGSWSVGIYQMSANDNAAKAEGVDYQGLKDPVKNIRVAMNQFRRQINNTNLVLLHKSSKFRYWAIILKDGKYEKIAEIKTRVLKQVPACK